MSCRLVQNIKHTDEYNAGGIKAIYLLDIEDFVAYRFRDDELYTSCFAEQIVAVSEYIELGAADGSSFTESYENGIFKQELTTFVRSLDAGKLSSLLSASVNKYLVTYTTMQGRAFSFGTEGGASLSFTQVTGKAGEGSGYNITLFKNSIYPLFEVSVDEINKSPKWILENGIWEDGRIWTRNGIWKTN